MVFLGANLIDGDYRTTVRAVNNYAAKNPKVQVAPSWKRPPKPPPKKKSSSSGGGGGGYSSSGGGGGGYSSSGIKKSADKAQVDALNKLIKSGFAKARDQRLANVDRLYRQQDASLLQDFRDQREQLYLARDDNNMSEADATFANVLNRAREAGDSLAQGAAQGVGETDNLRAQLMALRNFDANQADVSRSFYDTDRSINNSLTDLNSSTRNSRTNLAADMLSDKEQIWQNYQNQMSDAYTNLANIQASPYSDSYDKNADYSGMVKASSTAWKNPGIKPQIRKFDAVDNEDRQLNNSLVSDVVEMEPMKKPEGSTLRKWNV